MTDTDPIPRVSWWQIIAIGRNPKTTFIRLLITAVLVYWGFKSAILPISVSGISMQPTYRDGKRLFINKLAYKLDLPQRGDVVAIHEAGDRLYLLKRIIGLPGERLRIMRGTVYIDDEPLLESYLLPPTNGVVNPAPWELDEVRIRGDELFVIGDNRSMGKTDHYFGRVNSSRIAGRLIKP
jgi:signal peptidase I